MQPLYAQAAAQGQTVLVAAGNSGADGCRDGGDPSINSLASSALVTSVGGTGLDPGFDENGDATGRVSETVWNDENGAGGGGVSTVVTKPAYQNVPGVPADGFRDHPDVALMASPSNVGYVMFIRDVPILIGGTSAATPSWAGIVALVNQAAGRDGAGAINTALYGLGGHQYRGTGPVVFRDIVSGNNDFNDVEGFAATSGFDLASGLGVPDVAALVDALASAACMGDCNDDGKVSVDELVTAINIALDRIPAEQCAAIDLDGDGAARIDELIHATDNAINGCR